MKARFDFTNYDSKVTAVSFKGVDGTGEEGVFIVENPVAGYTDDGYTTIKGDTVVTVKDFQPYTMRTVEGRFQWWTEVL